ncbi:hypothetical protein BZK18_08040 [Helicobacter pylori]|uniref:hypothetical protein n=1 Tax=Helicobacter pylori TaxID=210 RepID=UPI00098989AA|nr:hypothetical protein [Helicobacter pylori]OOC20220.1 hypothetical protein BZK18_08040 [Helicobacter pylori]
MRQKHETAISFNELEAITQTIQALKKGAPTNATNQESERTQASENANISDLTQETGLKPKAMPQAKKGALNPTKKAFSERQKTTIRDNEQASAKKRLQTNQGNNSNLRAKQSNKAFKTGLTTHQSNKKGGKNEA